MDREREDARVEMRDVPEFLGQDRKELMSVYPLAAWDVYQNDWVALHVTYNTRSGAVGVLVVSVADGHGNVQGPPGRITGAGGEVVPVGALEGVPRKVRLHLEVVGVGDVPVEVSTSQGAWFARRINTDDE